MPRPKLSEHEKVRQRAIRLKIKLDECAQLMADELISDDPHTMILRANLLSERLAMAKTIVEGNGNRGEVVKALANLPGVADVHAFAIADDIHLRVGKINKTKEQEYLEMVSEFESYLAKLNEIEASEDLPLSVPSSIAQAAYSSQSYSSGRKPRGMLENLDRDLSEAIFTGRFALARAIDNEERPKTMGRPSRSVESVREENDRRATELEALIDRAESALAGAEILDRSAKIYRDVSSSLKRLVKEADGPTQSDAKAQLVFVETYLKSFKKERARYVENSAPDLPVTHLNSPRFHLLNAKSMLATVREIYNEIALEKDLKKFRGKK